MYLLARSVLPSGLGVIMWPQGQLSIDGGIGTSKCNVCVQLAAHDLHCIIKNKCKSFSDTYTCTYVV